MTKKTKGVRNKLPPFLAGRKVKNTFWWALFITITTLVLASGITNPSLILSEGEIAPEDIYYQGSVITYTSEIRTAEARTQAASRVEQIFSVNPQVVQTATNYINQSFGEILEYKNLADMPESQKIAQLKEKIPGDYDAAVLGHLLQARNEDILYLRDALNGIMIQVMQPGIMTEDFPAALTAMEASIDELNRTADITRLLKAVLAHAGLGPNFEYDAIATADEVERVIQGVEPVQVTIQPGEILASRGAYISAEQIEALQAAGMLSQRSKALPYLGLFVLVCLIYALLIAYIRLFHPLTNGRESNIVLLGSVINFTLLLCKLITLINISDQIAYAAQIGYLLPVSAASMLLCVLLGRGISVFVTILLGIFIGMLMGGQISFAIVAVIGGIVGIFHTMRLNQRSQFVEASVYIAAANVLTIGAWGLMNGQGFALIGLGMLLGLINGAFASILTIGLLPFIESVFRITTMVKLLELSNANHPLLKRLMMEAPGTYHHSILVGNLAEAAAGEIDADTLVARVASYYHDIGKIRRPYFFIENQMPGSNPHDKLQPTLSTLIITSHVKEGVEMLKEYKFPHEIIEIAEQHHGTGVLSYFHHKAMGLDEDQGKIRKEDFRYAGPKPQTKEAALVMLADSVQAAVQAMVNPAKGQMEQRVREIIKSKMDDGQLQESPLTFRDLDVIAQAFSKVLWGMHHSRIVYPEEVAKEMEREEYDHPPQHLQSAEENPHPAGADSPAAAGPQDNPSAGAAEQKDGSGAEPDSHR